MKEREFTAEMLNKLTEAKNSQGGWQYSMCGVSESWNMHQGKRSVYSIVGIPETTGTIKKVRGNWYIYTVEKDVHERYTVNENVKALLGLEG